jgi:hypothetical protein
VLAERVKDEVDVTMVLCPSGVVDQYVIEEKQAQIDVNTR